MTTVVYMILHLSYPRLLLFIQTEPLQTFLVQVVCLSDGAITLNLTGGTGSLNTLFVDVDWTPDN